MRAGNSVHYDALLKAIGMPLSAVQRGVNSIRDAEGHDFNVGRKGLMDRARDRTGTL